MTKILFIILSGKNESEKALSGMNLAYNMKTKNYVEDVHIMFFGPSEELIASNNENIKSTIKKLNEAGMVMMACKNVSDNMKITPVLMDLGIKVDYIGNILANYIKQGYVPMTF